MASPRRGFNQLEAMTMELWKSLFGTPRMLATRIAFFAVGYFVVAELGYRLLEYPAAPRVAVWPAAGLAVAGLTLFGRRAWPGIAIGGFLARLSADPWVKDTATMTVTGITLTGITMTGVVGPAMTAWLFEPYKLNSALTRLRDILIVILCGATGSFLSGMVSTTVVTATGVVARGYATLSFFAWWWVSDTMGIILVCPLLLPLETAFRLRINPFCYHGREAAVSIICTVVAARLLCGTTLPVSFLIFPFVLWVTLRLGVSGAAVLNVSMAGVAIKMSLEGQGPFARLSPTQNLIVLQSFIASMAIISLVLAAVTVERQQATDEVRASRVRIVETADVERRRVERNLHDGAQQHLVSISLLLLLAQTRLGAQPDPGLKATLSQASGELQVALTELQELARGLYPTILTHEGLGAAVQSLVEQAPFPVTMNIPPKRFPAVVEITAYFVVCEALANIAKHAQASAATVNIKHTDRRLAVEIADDGIGGAKPDGGSGLSGLADRVAALDGQLRLTSPHGGGTRVRAELPCD